VIIKLCIAQQMKNFNINANLESNFVYKLKI